MSPALIAEFFLLAALSATETRKRLGAGEFSVSDHARALLTRIDEVDPVVSAYLSFLEADMVTHPERLSPFSSADLAAARELTRGVEVSDDDALPDDVTI